jgi:cytosine/adenosine deaminase-related metal-dependent hydrolase
VFPINGDPISDGAVCMEGERIVACGASAQFASQELHDLGNVAILPGLINAHVHLDFSDLLAPLGYRGIPFVDWIRQVMAFRQQSASIDRQSLSRGLDESLRSGVTALGDIVQPGRPLAASPIEVTSLLELIAPTADRVAAAVELAKSYLNAGCCGSCTAGPERVWQSNCHPNISSMSNVGLSPHAPYSVHPDLLTAVVELSKQYKIPVAMHLAESREELELLQHGRGPLRNFLEELGAWDATAIPRGSRPMDYLRLLADAERALVVHGNYLDDEEIALLGAAADRMSVVYCPRTHDWFAHRDYPLEKLLAAGATVALGTDGRGSSPDLNLLEEMRFAAGKHPGVPLADMLKMATINAARALGRETEIGSLVRGKRADLAIVALPDRSAADPHELLFAPAASVVACYCRGVEVYRSGNAATS